MRDGNLSRRVCDGWSRHLMTGGNLTSLLNTCHEANLRHTKRNEQSTSKQISKIAVARNFEKKTFDVLTYGKTVPSSDSKDKK